MLRRVFVPVVLLMILGAACGGTGDSGSSPNRRAGEGQGSATLRLGYFPNVTHASALVGVERGIFARALGDRAELKTMTFNAGPAAVEALFSNGLDAAYIGPNPTINAFVRSKGSAIRIVSGATSGGASLVVKLAIGGPADLKGKKLASPQLGGTQDVALRGWLAERGLRTTPQGAGDLAIVPQENAQTLETFRSDRIDGAWVPEPWATRLVQEGGGKVLVDERTLWPEGRFVTTHLVVRTDFLRRNPEVVERLLQGQVEANTYLHSSPVEARQVVNQGIERITGKKLPEPILAAAWAGIEFTNDPIASSLATSARKAQEVGLLERVDLDGIYDLSMLNRVLGEKGETEVREQ